MIFLMLLLLIGPADAGRTPPQLPSGWRIGMVVLDAVSGDTVLSRSPNELFRPASTMKIATTILALRQLGPGYVYHTCLLADTSSRTLYLRGSGAPLLSTEDVSRAAIETACALPGTPGGEDWDLVYDLTWFDEATHCPGWDILDWGRAYCPPITAICVGDNLVEIVVSTVDGLVEVMTYPPLPGLTVSSLLRISGETRIVSSVEGWENGPPVITLEGTVKQGEVLTLYRPFPGPPRELSLWLESELEAAGVPIGTVREGTAPTDTLIAVSVATMYSQPLQSLLTSMNKWSRNQLAEQVLRTVAAETLGLPGSTESGCDMMGLLLDSIAPGADRPIVADGSGLSRLNRMSPAHLVALLQAGCSSLEWGPEFLASLPVNGRDGTLRTRMEDLPDGAFRGKTGTLNDTCTIAGLLRTASGGSLYVAIMLEIPSGQVYRARDWQDSYLEYLYETY
ncbi:D-alanyl-D-alanine carboxypeptidase/D-alanyl-D-alanine-endopeptidase [Candidatus Fermentibacterales bacterium]|nr:D-alanyl-D-alanine carboxypeptidase/D-alanyl-D-alanine-endopeptidase [Candidatus Fermentibacterales bacterium]